MEVERLDGLICGMWSSRSISAHNQITDIRALIGLLGGDFLSLGHVDKRDSTDLRPVIQAHLYVGDELGTQPDVRRRMDIL